MCMNDELEFAEYLLSFTSENQLLRKLMNKEEIRIANKLVKSGLLIKGRTDDKQKSICYYNVE